MRRRFVFLALLIGLTVFSRVPLLAQGEVKPPEDVQKKFVASMAQAGFEDMKKAELGGEPTPESKQIAKKWEALLWEYHASHPGTAAAARAAYHAINLLRNAGLQWDIEARAEALPPGDSAWKETIELLYLAKHNSKDFAWYVKKVRVLSETSPDTEIRARASLFAGRALFELNQNVEAAAAFESARKEMPDSEIARQASQFLFEMANLRIGQTVPEFSATSTAGERITPAKFRGKVTLISFWASW